MVLRKHAIVAARLVLSHRYEALMTLSNWWPSKKPPRSALYTLVSNRRLSVSITCVVDVNVHCYSLPLVSFVEVSACA